mmetsp:Transcript_11982/g.36486  ORF Transcript_11982/g.36486 Transcript_11982/m.36486 type:complete len:259 (-) Transcript_11982:51-827(-)
MLANAVEGLYSSSKMSLSWTCRATLFSSSLLFLIVAKRRLLSEMITTLRLSFFDRQSKTCSTLRGVPCTILLPWTLTFPLGSSLRYMPRLLFLSFIAPRAMSSISQRAVSDLSSSSSTMPLFLALRNSFLSTDPKLTACSCGASSMTKISSSGVLSSSTLRAYTPLSPLYTTSPLSATILTGTAATCFLLIDSLLVRSPNAAQSASIVCLLVLLQRRGTVAFAQDVSSHKLALLWLNGITGVRAVLKVSVLSRISQPL